MSRMRVACIAVLAVLAAPGLALAEIKVLDWNDLLPPNFFETVDEANAVRDELDAMPEETQDIVYKIRRQRMLRSRLKSGELTRKSLIPPDQALLKQELVAKHPQEAMIADEIDRIGAQFDLLDKTPNAKLDGQTIRMPGYVLPLEFDGTEAVEFLLVPFVGACIHVPPPPPNQMVHVNFKPGFVSEGLYTPVYVTGRISAIGGTHDLTLTDGAAPVETGYRLEAVTVEPYKE